MALACAGECISMPSIALLSEEITYAVNIVKVTADHTTAYFWGMQSECNTCTFIFLLIILFTRV